MLIVVTADPWNNEEYFSINGSASEDPRTSAGELEMHCAAAETAIGSARRSFIDVCLLNGGLTVAK